MESEIPNDSDEIRITGTLRMSIIKRHLDQGKNNRSSFKYTVPNGCLTNTQREDYEKNGFIVVKKLVSSEKLDKYKTRFKKICSEKLVPPNMTVMKDVAIAKSEFLESEKAITKIQDFCFDDELFEYCCLPEIVNHVKSITGPNVMAMHTMLINKPPGWYYVDKIIFLNLIEN